MCGHSITNSYVIDITDPINPVTETMITYAEASAQITILVPAGSAPSLDQITKQYVMKITMQSASGFDFSPPADGDTFSILYAYPNNCYLTSFSPTATNPILQVGIEVVS